MDDGYWSNSTMMDIGGVYIRLQKVRVRNPALVAWSFSPDVSAVWLVFSRFATVRHTARVICDASTVYRTIRFKFYIKIQI